jgi:hypothetical protein
MICILARFFRFLCVSYKVSVPPRDTADYLEKLVFDLLCGGFAAAWASAF